MKKALLLFAVTFWLFRGSLGHFLGSKLGEQSIRMERAKNYQKAHGASLHESLAAIDRIYRD